MGRGVEEKVVEGGKEVDGPAQPQPARPYTLSESASLTAARIGIQSVQV